MSKIVDWEYYNSLYDNVKLIDFQKLEARAEQEISAVVGPIRWASISESTFGYEQLKNCICNVINKTVEMDNSCVGKGIASVSNAGYSESYVIQTEVQLREERRILIKGWLSGTGLVGAY